MAVRAISLRRILLLVTGALTLIIALAAAWSVYSDWRRLSDITELRDATTLSDRLFDATERLSVERDIALSMLQAEDADTIENLRPRLEESREASDAALAATVAALDQHALPNLGELRQRIESHTKVLMTLRPQIDAAIEVPKSKRSQALPERWSAEVTASMADTENLWIGFVRNFTGIDPVVTQHLWFKHVLRQITDHTGRERSLVGQLIVESSSPTPEQLEQLLRGQGIVETSWAMSRVLADQSALYPAIAPVYADASSHYSTMRDMIQNMVYVAEDPGPVEYPITADLWFELSTQASDSLGALKDRSIAETRAYVEALIGQTRTDINFQATLALFSLLLCAYSFYVINGRVIRPINQMVVALMQATRGEPVTATLPTNRHDEIGQLAVVLDAFQKNVDETKRTTKQLVQAQKMEAVGQLTGGIAHDFNNLLGIVVGNLDLLETELKGNPVAQGFAQDALNASLRGSELTQQLLAFSRRKTLEAKPLSLNAIVANTAQLLRRALGERVEIRLDLAEDLALALADQTQVESALTNLAINARDAMQGVGVLTIETANKILDEHYHSENPEVAPGPFVMLAVSDTGSGMPPEVLERAFEPFFTTKAEGKGTGLGLSMVYGFAKQSRGHVKIYSEVGHGTTVRLYLPRAAGSAEIEIESLEELRAPPESATILVVEDNDGVRRIAVNQLGRLGYRVIEAVNGDNAVPILQSDQTIDLLFTDVIMPGAMTGDVLAREARELRPGLKVLFASGFAEASIRGGATPRDIDGHRLLSKPYRMQDLARRIRETLAE
jgi:signal transduction histidine kinase/CheY-like chemotaxis protein